MTVKMTQGILKGSEILLLEDEPILRKRLAAYLEKQGAELCSVGTVEQARNAASSMPFDFALLDLGLPDGNGLDLLREKCFSPATAVIVMTSQGGVEVAVEAMKLGAYDFLAKPVEPDALALVIARSRKARSQKRISEYEKETRKIEDGSLFFGRAMDSVRTQLERIRKADERLATRLPPVLIEGETGTGKTSIARWLHNNSPRANKALVDINCSALPEQLAESELFGHERGSFTDAKEARIGLFEAADGGTLFLDEIPSLSLPLQAKVLKAVEDGRIRRVGASRDIEVDVRLITATNRDMRELVAKGEFREDLLHRLDLLRVQLPPLRDWGNDIALLAEHILHGLEKKYRLEGLHISPEGHERLLSWRWPGNIRELSHELERAVVLSMGDAPLDFASLPVGGRARSETNDRVCNTDDWFNEAYVFPQEGGFDIEAAILRIINRAIAQSGGNVSAAAKLLGVPRDYIRYRLKAAQ
ncbi:MAG: sigma-54-dependent Fis family transcriptional regulator [Opitutales bacterium]|nr:sigma-54-dependent Fis family transcriptional regulator [Opitutales bacterium]